MFKEYPDILSVAQVAQALCIGRKAAYALIHAHMIGFLKIGKTIKVPKTALIEYVQTARNNTRL